MENQGYQGQSPWLVSKIWSTTFHHPPFVPSTQFETTSHPMKSLFSSGPSTNVFWFHPTFLGASLPSSEPGCSRDQEQSCPDDDGSDGASLAGGDFSTQRSEIFSISLTLRLPQSVSI
jgi:hypothetical protein